MQQIDLAGFFAQERLHHLGESVTHPIEPHFGTLAALLRQGTEALAFARHKQSSGLFMFGLGLARAPNCSPLGRVQLRFLG